MRFRIYSNQLQIYVAAEEYFVNGNGDIFFFDILDRELIKAPEGSFVIELCEQGKETVNSLRKFARGISNEKIED